MELEKINDLDRLGYIDTYKFDKIYPENVIFTITSKGYYSSQGQASK